MVHEFEVCLCTGCDLQLVSRLYMGRTSQSQCGLDRLLSFNKNLQGGMLEPTYCIKKTGSVQDATPHALIIFHGECIPT